MKYGVSVPPFGDYGDARYLADRAREAEDAGWDGFFICHEVSTTTVKQRLRVSRPGSGGSRRPASR